MSLNIPKAYYTKHDTSCIIGGNRYWWRIKDSFSNIDKRKEFIKLLKTPASMSENKHLYYINKCERWVNIKDCNKKNKMGYPINEYSDMLPYYIKNKKVDKYCHTYRDVINNYGFNRVPESLLFMGKYDCKMNKIKKMIKDNEKFIEYMVILFRRRITREKIFVEQSNPNIICKESYQKFLSSCSEPSIHINITEFNKHIGNIFKSNEDYYNKYKFQIKSFPVGLFSEYYYLEKTSN